MNLSDFPFATVTLGAFAVFLVTGMLAKTSQLIWKGASFKDDTFLDRHWGPAGFVRFFTVRRSQVHLPFSWACIVLGRAAFVVLAISLTLDLLIN